MAEAVSGRANGFFPRGEQLMVIKKFAPLPTADMERRRDGRGGDGPRDSGPTGEVIGLHPGSYQKLSLT